jgi:hypothetical protein
VKGDAVPFDLIQAVAVLKRTPGVLDAKLRGLPEEWIYADDGPGTWSPFDVVGHLIHGEKTDWIPRTRIILAQGPEPRFEPFDRFAQEEESRGKTPEHLLAEFASLRAGNLKILRGFGLKAKHLEWRGIHPDFGPVTLAQHLTTWVVHDLDHLAQIDRTMARRWRDEAGPWRAYLPILG